MKMGGESLTLI